MQNLKPLIIISFFAFLVGCSSLDHQEDIIPESIDTSIEESQYEITTLPPPTEVTPKDKVGCNCRITLDASPLIQQSTWIHDFAYFTLSNSEYMAHTYLYGSPNIPLPRSYDMPYPIRKNSFFYHELPFDYHANPIERGGTLTFKLACEVAPPYIKTFHLPSVTEVGGGTLTFRAEGRITSNCGTIGLELETD